MAETQGSAATEDAPAEAKKATTKTTPEPLSLTYDRLVADAPHRFGVEPFVVAGALSGKMRGETMTVDRAQKLIDEYNKTDGNMEVGE